MKKILIIEDDYDFRQVLVQMLNKLGFDVMEAENGSHALQLCSETKPDLVLTDIIMLDKEGLETIQELLSSCPNLKIIAMSGGGRIDANSYLPLAEKLGAKKTLQKPFLREELIAAIEEVLGEPIYN